VLPPHGTFYWFKATSDEPLVMVRIGAAAFDGVDRHGAINPDGKRNAGDAVENKQVEMIHVGSLVPLNPLNPACEKPTTALAGAPAGGRHGLLRSRSRADSSALDGGPGAVSVGAMLAGGVGLRGSTGAAQTAETASAALDVLRKSISVDVHTHGGKNGITSKAPPNDDLANAMRAGSLAVACLAERPGWPILARNAEGALAPSDIRAGPALRHQSRTSSLDGRDGRQSRPASCPCRGRPRAAHKAAQPADRSGCGKGSISWTGSSSGWRKAHKRGISTCSSFTTRPTTSAISRPAPSPIGPDRIRAE